MHVLQVNRQLASAPAIVIGLAMALVGCQAPSASDVVGDYLESRPNARVLLSLRSDGTFTERVEVAGGATVAADGKWTYRERDGVVSLEGAIYPDHDALNPASETGKKLDGLWLLSAERGIRGIRLTDSPDLGFAFRKR